MPFSDESQNPLHPKWFLRWITATFLGLLPMILLLIGTQGCDEKEVQMARTARLPEELNGFMRLVQTKVKVQVIGAKDDLVREFSADEVTDTAKKKPEYKHLSAYIVLHELDVRMFIRNTQRLKEVEEELAQLEAKWAATKGSPDQVAREPPR